MLHISHDINDGKACLIFIEEEEFAAICKG